MKIDLLKKVSIGGGPLSFFWIARIENPVTILGPGRASAAGRKLDMFNHFRQLFAGGYAEKVKVPIFSSILGERNGNKRSIR